MAFEKICAWLSRSGAIVSGGVILGMVLVVVFDVTGRNVFNSPLLGSVELNRALLVLVVYSGLGYTQLQDGHIRVEVVLLHISVRQRLILESFALLVALGVVGYMCYVSIPVTYHSVIIREYETGAILFPVWPARLFLVIGLVFYVLQLGASLKTKLQHSHKKIEGTS